MFQIRGEQFVALRRKKIGDALIGVAAPLVGAARWDAAEEVILLEDQLGPRGTLGFDPQGFLATYTSPLGRTWQLANTAEGKPLRIGSPSGHVVSMAYGNDGLLASFVSTTQSQTNLFYDGRRWAGSTYADGTWDRLEYTPFQELARLTNRLGSQVVCEHDEHRRLAAIRDGNGNTTRFLYSQWSRPDAVLYPDGAGEAFSYDKEGKLAGIVQGDVRIGVEVDAAGRATRLAYVDGPTLEYAYSDAGMIAKASDGVLETAFTYNDAGQVNAEMTGDQTSTFTYDAGHRLTELQVHGQVVTFRWDPDQRLVGYTDWLGGEHTIEHLPGERGHVTTGPAGLRAFAQLEVGGRLAQLNITGGGRSRFSLACSYDAEGRLSASSDSVFGNRAFTYDADSRLLHADASTPERREAFAYDAAGNLLVVNGQRLVYDAANQLLRAGADHLTWDDRGNLIARLGPQGSSWRFAYNARNQLITSFPPSGPETHYTYDALGRRRSKRTGTRETRFIWAGEQLAAELHFDLTLAANGLARPIGRQDFLYHPETGAPLATCVNGEVYTYATDQLGTPRALFSSTGEAVWLAELSAYGSATVVVETVPQPLRFRGQYHDPETGLHYNRFRYYAPEWGRYITRDPLTFLAGTNHYQYADANPINTTDPSGLFSWKTVAVIAASVAVAAAVVVLAPVALPLAIVLGGAAAGAVGAGLNEALNEKHLSLVCIAKAAAFGALAGAAAALPFLALPASAGILAFAGAGALGGALSYGVNCADGVEKNPSLKGLATSMLVGGATAGVLKGVGDAAFGGAPEGEAATSSGGDAAPDAIPEQTSEATSGEAPEPASESTSQPASEPSSEPTTASAPESSPATTPESASPSSSEASPESTTESDPPAAGDSAAQPANVDPATAKAIQDTPKGSRPDPSTYMSQDAIDSHLAQFNDGASRFMTESNLAKYGPSQRDGTAFVMPKGEADSLLASANGDPAAMEQALGLPNGFLSGNNLVRVDIPNPQGAGLRMPSGNEAGANDQWIPGGQLPDGNNEAIVDLGKTSGNWKSSPVTF